MQFKTENRPMITVYRADVANLRKTLASGVLYQQVVDQMVQHFNGHALRVDARIEFEDAAPCGMADASLIDIRALLGNMNIYTIVKIGMRLSDSCLDRWVEVDKRDTILRLDGALFGVRCTNGVQSEAANMYYVDLEAELLTAFGHRTTHIYIPSTENKEIPIYPCEPFGVKKVNPKPAPAEPDTNPVTVNLTVNTSAATATMGSFGKAVTDLAREIQVSNLKAAARNPEVREALFKALRKDGDKETLTALFRLSQAASFGIKWDEVIGETRKPTK